MIALTGEKKKKVKTQIKWWKAVSQRQHYLLAVFSKQNNLKFSYSGSALHTINGNGQEACKECKQSINTVQK